MKLVIVNPPVTRASEPPIALLRLAGAIPDCALWDANLEGIEWLLDTPPPPGDIWTRRAVKNLSRDRAALRAPGTYSSPGSYRTATGNLNRVLKKRGEPDQVNLSLANYQHNTLVPQKSADLLRAAEEYSENIFCSFFREKMIMLCDKQAPSFIGISFNYLNQGLCGMALAGMIFKEFSHLKLIAGGGLLTAWMGLEGWKNPFRGLFHYQVKGPGEEPLKKILGIKDAPGSFYSISFKGLEKKSYFSPGLIIPYNASRGCFWNQCTFCPEDYPENRYNPLPEDRVAGDLKELNRRYKPILFHLADNALSDPLYRALINNPPGAPWYGFARISSFLEDEDNCRLLAASGCVMLKLGVESGDEKVLESINKGINLKMTERVLRNLKAAGIGAYVYLLFGTPAEDEAAARRTLEFTLRNRAFIHFLNLSIFNMPLNTTLARQYERGNFYEGDLSLFTGFRHPLGWDRKKVREFIEYEFKKHRELREIINAKPPSFTANHAPLFLPFTLPSPG